MGSIEIFVIFAVAALDLAVMSWSIRLDELVTNAEPVKRNFEKRLLVRALWVEAVGELRAVVRLDAFNGIWEAFNTMLDELRRRIGIMLFEGFQIPKAAVFVDESILVIVTAVLFRIFDSTADQA